jgi:hypothetical protein
MQAPTDASLRKQLADSEATVAKMRDKINSQRDTFDEKVARLMAETRDVNERALRERQSFQQVLIAPFVLPVPLARPAGTRRDLLCSRACIIVCVDIE